MLRIIINGALGKMGHVLTEMAGAADDIKIVAGVDFKKPETEGAFPIYDNIMKCDVEADALIDFSRHDALPELLSYSCDRRMPIVLATTGYSPAEHKLMERASQTIPIFQTANMSLGVNLLKELSAKSAAFLGACDVEIVETHHRTKLDAPSGTALMLADAVNEASGGDREYIYGRHSRTEPRLPREIGIHALRGGTVVGEHTVKFILDDEVLTLTHGAQSRAIYAAGALKAARFIVGRPPRIYSMSDMLLDKADITRLTIDREVTMLTVSFNEPSPDALSNVFDALAKADINIDMIAFERTHNDCRSVSFSLPIASQKAAINALERTETDITCSVGGSMVKLTVEGLGMVRQSGVAARVFGLMKNVNVSPRMVTTSVTEISMLLDTRDEFRAADAMAREFGI